VFGLGYALSAMIFSGMLYLPPHPLATGGFFYIYPRGPGPSWNYPAILAGGPYFQLDLPFLSAILMVLTAAGVGLGMALAVFLGVRLLRDRRDGRVWPTAIGTSAGLTPAMIALVTLGACCSTTAAATAGISLAAQSSGTTTAVLLANAWYLGFFQVAVVYLALLAQEQLVGIYGVLLGWTIGETAVAGERPRPLGWAGAGSGMLRIVLAAAGITWSLTMLADWISTPPGRAGVSAWFGWIVQHQVPGLLAISVALFPAAVAAFWATHSETRRGRALRGALIAAGLALLTWMPAPVSRAGAAALGNELLGYWHLSAGWGAVSPPALGPLGLTLRWGFQFVLLGLLSISLGLWPEATLRPFLRSSAARVARPSNAADPGRTSADVVSGPTTSRATLR